MLSAINLDNDSRFAAEEVTNILPDRHLPTEFDAIDLSISKRGPEFPFRVCGIVAKCLRPCGRSKAKGGHKRLLPTPYPSRKREGL